MGLLSFLSKSSDAPRDANASDPVAQARTRARRRLIGAALLVGAGIIGFPLLFETQPRPIPVDLPIVIPRKEAVAPLAPPKPRPAPSAPAEPAANPTGSTEASAAAPTRAGDAGVITESRADAGREVPPPKPAAKAEARPEPKVETKAKADPKPEARDDDAARVKALLEGKDGATGRSVVQVGAFADANVARDVRQRVEKLGIKTYTQVVETSEGKRIRVRVGPFASREEAEKTMAKLKSAGLSAAVLAL